MFRTPQSFVLPSFLKKGMSFTISVIHRGRITAFKHQGNSSVLSEGRRKWLRERAKFQMPSECKFCTQLLLIQFSDSLVSPGEGKCDKAVYESVPETFTPVRLHDYCCNLLDGFWYWSHCMCICCEKMWDTVDQLDLKRNKSDGVMNQIRRCSLEEI